MLRNICRGITSEISSSRYLNRKASDSSKDNSPDDIAYQMDYLCKQDKKLLEVLKQKTQDEVRNMQNEVNAMRNKIEEYNRDINENLRFLKGLEQDLSASDKK